MLPVNRLTAFFIKKNNRKALYSAIWNSDNNYLFFNPFLDQPRILFTTEVVFYKIFRNSNNSYIETVWQDRELRQY